MTAAYRFAFLAALASSAACTVHGDKTPPLAGPSEFATSITVTATPDSIAQDGASQSSIAVTARDVNGKGISALSLRLGMAVNGIGAGLRAPVRADHRDRVGRPGDRDIHGASSAAVARRRIGESCHHLRHPDRLELSDGEFAVSAEIRLVPPGVVLPPAGTPTPVFTVTPTPVLAGVAANFDASRSCATASRLQFDRRHHQLRVELRRRHVWQWTDAPRIPSRSAGSIHSDADSDQRPGCAARLRRSR